MKKTSYMHFITSLVAIIDAPKFWSKLLNMQKLKTITC